MSSVKLKIGVVAAALSNEPRRIPRLSRQMGFDGLQFDAGWPALNLASLADSGRRELRHLLATESQQFIGLRTDLGTQKLAPGADIDRILSGADRLLEAAAGLGAPLVCLDLGVLPEPEKVAPAKPVIPAGQSGMILIPEPSKPIEAPQAASVAPDPAHVSVVSVTLEELGRRADRFSVMVAMRSELSSLAALTSALRTANCPWFGFDLDPVALLHDDWELDAIFSEVGQQIRHVRARDATAGADRRTRPAAIGAGSTDWRALLAMLDAAGYHGWLTIDPTDLQDRVAAATAGLAALRQIEMGK
jgi:sugar phosphate isomerase/epimerase